MKHLIMLKSWQSYEYSPMRLWTALSSRAPYTRAVVVMYVNLTSFQRALGILPLNSRREYLNPRLFIRIKHDIKQNSRVLEKQKWEMSEQK